ncbi:NADH dehydrogenase [ubiquinone] 1 beta subcomplex subunit 11, mitochondrial [Gallus gallus]|uniref:NADH dehydrogenase [ubiquinone] 1 beta subcomplex subunit 11, mitochondrial n=1 Tax=Gallus gallus TaxID=9031 RepID=A0A8V0X535_CHICK|nr:NADH dehydrogenase [ubiquinone] 1 beta subcomplex subunit 11, mitochondrial [Gallus gallus]XP_040551154.1 NADH dehydrogenase [ubiquinone] 1 beta subcomplex subunit 11, mitochondrial [Gallus gallus]
MAALGRAIRSLRGPWGARGRSAGPAAVVAVPRETIGAHREEETWEDAQRKHPDLHGFYTDPAADLANARAVFIAGVSVALVLGSAFLHYLPDGGLQQWSRREAERLIRDRELRGLPLLDPNYYDPKRLDLPPPRD